MSNVDRREANLDMIAQAEEQQNATKETVFRIDRQLAETEEIGNQTLEELRKQGSQMDDINSDLHKVDTKLEHSAALQSQFDRWAGNWFGGKKRAAEAEAAAEIASRDMDSTKRIKEVFEHETYAKFSRAWKPVGFVLCNAPTVEAPNIFLNSGPEAQTNWMIDYSLAGIDAEGWTYAYDFNTLNKTGAGEAKPAWNSYVRRRKWRYHETRKTENAQINEVRDRNAARMEKLKPTRTGNAAEKIGYVPRAQQARMAQSGLSNARMGAGKSSEEELDEDSAAGLAQLRANDAEIDEGMERIGAAIDRIGNLASAMGSEARSHTDKLETIDKSMTKTSDKTTVVNSRQKFLLK
eukprot:GSChrysophyteH1.ASY1.ANO1.2495.1 assembled CDS